MMRQIADVQKRKEKEDKKKIKNRELNQEKRIGWLVFPVLFSPSPNVSFPLISHFPSLFSFPYPTLSTLFAYLARSLG